jgi:hypothetical protein
MTGGSQTVQSVTTAASKPVTDVVEPPVCTDWYADYYIDGEFWFTEYLGETCSVGGGGGGSSSGSGSTGGVSAPPPPQCPSGSGSGDESVAHLTINVAAPPPGGSGGDDGGMPPPSDPCTTTVVEQPDTTKTPCAQASAIGAMEADAILANQNKTILNQSTSDEYGTSQNLTSWPGSTYMNVPITTDYSPTTFSPPFSWDPTNGYTIGFSHGHPDNSPPSPLDAFIMIEELSNSNLIAAGALAKQYYQNNASSTIVTSSGNYVITVNSWSALQNVYNQYTTQGSQVFLADYQQLSDKYQIANPNASLTEAGEYAFLQTFGSAVNLYSAISDSNTYNLLGIDSSAEVAQPCP